MIVTKWGETANYFRSMAFTTLRDYIDAGLPGSFDYKSFRALVKELLDLGKVTGNQQTERLLSFTRLNEHRMDKWEKHYRIRESLLPILKNHQTTSRWILITEGWCGDSAQTLPMIAKMAEAAGVSLHIVLRDENDWLMQQYLTNGSRSIPLLIGVSSEGVEVFRWGPRPSKIQEMYLSMKSSTDPVYTSDQAKEAIHLFYAKDKGMQLEEDFAKLL